MNHNCTICGRKYFAPYYIPLEGDDRYCITCAAEACEQRQDTAKKLAHARKALETIFHVCCGEAQCKSEAAGALGWMDRAVRGDAGVTDTPGEGKS